MCVRNLHITHSTPQHTPTKAHPQNTDRGRVTEGWTDREEGKKIYEEKINRKTENLKQKIYILKTKTHFVA